MSIFFLSNSGGNEKILANASELLKICISQDHVWYKVDRESSYPCTESCDEFNRMREVANLSDVIIVDLTNPCFDIGVLLGLLSADRKNNRKVLGLFNSELGRINCNLIIAGHYLCNQLIGYSDIEDAKRAILNFRTGYHNGIRCRR